MARKTITCGFAGAILRTTVRRQGIPVDISGASVLQVQIFRPDGTAVTQTAVFTNSGTDGQVQYVTVATDTAPGGTNLPGVYRFRFRIVNAAQGIDGWLDDHQLVAEEPT